MKKLVLSKGTRYVHGRNEETTASQFFPIDAVFFFVDLCRAICSFLLCFL